jgi:hypothetical protein
MVMAAVEAGQPCPPIGGDPPVYWPSNGPAAEASPRGVASANAAAKITALMSCPPGSMAIGQRHWPHHG